MMFLSKPKQSCCT